MKGLGIHVFAGGFTQGVRQAIPVDAQFEIHDFGRQTVEAMDVEFINVSRWTDWLDYESVWKSCQFCYGNPRCTAFSNYSSGCSSKSRGPTAAPTQDIWDLCKFGVEVKFELITFESVQQIYSVGKPLLNKLTQELFVPNGYRVCHLFVNTAAEGNAQFRRRYFYVAYKNDRNFNITLPDLPEYRVTAGDVLQRPEFAGKPTRAGDIRNKKRSNYDAYTYHLLNDQHIQMIQHMSPGESYTRIAKTRPNDLKVLSPELWEKWEFRTSGLPFSLHSPFRLDPKKSCPTISSSAHRYLHPWENRPLTVGEIAAMMGWANGFIPVGPQPISQIGKGVVPATGKWLAEQIKAYLTDAWGNEDFESNYDHHTGHFIGEDFTVSSAKPLEKVFNLTHYVPPLREDT